jgi:hypothetical protein
MLIVAVQMSKGSGKRGCERGKVFDLLAGVLRWRSKGRTDDDPEAMRREEMKELMHQIWTNG